MKVTHKQAEAVLSELHKKYPWKDKEDLPQLRTDDNGWTDGMNERHGYYIMWEEGPYEWVYNDSIFITVNGRQVYTDPVCAWGLVQICAGELQLEEIA